MLCSADASNVARLDQLANLPATVKQEITRAVTEDGAKVLVPDSQTTIGGWTGIGYILDEGATIEYRISGGANGGVLATVLDAAADDFNDFTEHILPCLLAINDLGDANNLSLAALAAWALVTFNIVDVGAALAIAAGPFAPIIAMLLLTAAIYFLLQVYTDGEECTSGNEG